MKQKKRTRRRWRLQKDSCHTQRIESIEQTKLRKIVLVGSPNVGKSVIFNNLSGLYATISNYPGTTVDVMRGRTQIGGEEFEVIDTPGMYSLLPITDEERVGRLYLLTENPAVVLHIVDAKNLERMLPQTLQLLETGLKIVLVLNIMDEAIDMGIKIDVEQLETNLRIPVVVTVATKGQGMVDLKRKIEQIITAQTTASREL